MQRHFRPPSRLHTCITFDGSPAGGGATLQIGVPSMTVRTSHKIAYYWQTTWTKADEALLEAKIGDPASQARWEAYALLLACIRWLPALENSVGTVHFMGDALGILFDALSFRAKDTTLNRMMAELALSFAPLGLELAVTHCWSEHNDLCDKLIRKAADVSDSRLRAASLSPDYRPAWRLLSIKVC